MPCCIANQCAEHKLIGPHPSHLQPREQNISTVILIEAAQASPYKPKCWLVSEPDPRKIRKEGLGYRLGRKCTVRPECRRTSDWFMGACLCVFIGNTNRQTENKQDLQMREVFGA